MDAARVTSEVQLIHRSAGSTMHHRTVRMEPHPVQQHTHFVYFELNPGDEGRTDGYYMPRSIFEDMGEPEVITVVVTPGDSLNAEDGDDSV